MLVRFQNDTMDAILREIVQTASSKDLPFCKDALLEQVLQLKVVAMESRHEKATYFPAVFQSLKGKVLVSDDQFRRYLLALLGDKEQEKVFDRMSKVDKAFKSSPGLIVLGNHVVLVSAGQGELRWNSSGVMPVKGMDTTRRIVEFVRMVERNKPQRPNAEGGLKTVNEGSSMHLKEMLRYNGL